MDVQDLACLAAHQSDVVAANHTMQATIAARHSSHREPTRSCEDAVAVWGATEPKLLRSKCGAH
eukprot:9462704-Lingulodinium_polyedra.AAC.1